MASGTDRERLFPPPSRATEQEEAEAAGRQIFQDNRTIESDRGRSHGQDGDSDSPSDNDGRPGRLVIYRECIEGR
jgi:hypothetical protein